jgi:hypothetical protein
MNTGNHPFTVTFKNQSMSPVENLSEEGWHMIGPALTTQYEKTKEERGRTKAREGTGKKGNVANKCTSATRLRMIREIMFIF